MRRVGSVVAGPGESYLVAKVLPRFIHKHHPEASKEDGIVAVIGDVLGTIIRLTLRKLCLRTRTST